MKKWNMIVDVANCNNCNNCTMAVKDEYVGNEFPGYSGPQPLHGHRWINIERRDRGSGSLMDVGYLPTTCNQCDNAPCIAAATNNAVYKRPDGIVMIDPVRSKGQKHLVASCPYGHIWWNEELNVPQKYSFDAHLLDNGWTEPRITQVCASGCLSVLKAEDEEMQARAKAEQLETLQPELGAKPRVWYKNLYRFTKEHIAGSVATMIDGLEEACVEAEVKLMRNGSVLAEQEADFFGDFKFDGLDPDSGAYTVRIQWREMERDFPVTLQKSTNLGVLRLED